MRDEKKDELYLEWCDEWLYWMYKCLKSWWCIICPKFTEMGDRHDAVKLSSNI